MPTTPVEGVGRSKLSTMLVSEGLLDVVAANRDVSEADRRLSDGSFDAIRSAGLLQLLVPARVGGMEASLGDMVANVAKLGETDGAASWVLMVLVAHDWMLGSFNETLQDEVYADGPHTAIPGSLAPAGRAVPVDGGWRLTGRWPFASGADHGDWYLVGTICPSDGDRPKLLHVVVPRSDVTIDDTWRPLGLRGSGSSDVVVDDVLVPEYRTIDSGVLLGGRSEWSSRHRTNLYRTPILPGLAVHVAASALGIARGGLADATARLTGQNDAYLGSAKSERPGVQMRLAESTAELRSAELLIDDTVRLLAHAAAGNDSKELRAHAKYQAGYAIELARRALERVLGGAGARAAFDDSRLQRAHRDVSMASQHAVADLDGVGMAYGRTLLGLAPGPHPL